jgi:hypothetical protein
MEFVETFVTDEDVEKGHRQTRGKCAVAYAIARANPQARWILVDQDEIRFTDIDTRKRVCFVTSEDVRQFISQWDQGNESGRPTISLTRRNLKWRKSQSSRTASDVVRRTTNVSSTTTRKPLSVSAKSISKRPLLDPEAA